MICGGVISSSWGNLKCANVCRSNLTGGTRGKDAPVAGVRLQTLDHVFGDRTDSDGLALSQVNQVGCDLRAMITWGFPANTEAGGWRIGWCGPVRPILLFLIFIRFQWALVPLQLRLLYSVNVANGCRHWARCLTQHCLTERSHPGHIHSLHNSKSRHERTEQHPHLTTRWGSNVNW